MVPNFLRLFSCIQCLHSCILQDMELLLRIDSLSFGGSGVGRASGKVVFVPYSAPGDDIKVRITRDAKGFAEGDIVEIISAAPLRKEPPCPYHADCGGCQWLHIPYADQLKAKEEIFRDTLRRIGKIAPSIVKPIQPSPQELNYRSRVQFKVSGNRIGFYKRESHDLVDISECPLAHPLINSILKGARDAWHESMKSVERLDVNISPSEGNGILSLYLKERSGFDFAHFFKIIRQAIPEVTGLITHYHNEEKVYGTPYLFSQEGAFRFRASEGSFSQVNYCQNLNMKEDVLSTADMGGNENVLELYSGGGNFTMPMAARAAKVLGIEVGRSSISDALENVRLNSVKNVTFINATAEKGLREFRRGATTRPVQVYLVLMDPPRDGCSQEVIEGVAALRPEKIIYVSCNPSTLARDLGRFHALGYAARSSRPFDMFPQTYHIESVTELLRL